MRCVLGPLKAVPADTPSPMAAAAASGTATATAGILAFSALCSCSPSFPLPPLSFFSLLVLSFFLFCVGHDVTRRLQRRSVFLILLASLSWRDSKNRVFKFLPGRHLLQESCFFFLLLSLFTFCKIFSCVLSSGIYLGQREAVNHFPFFFSLALVSFLCI